MDLFIGNDGTLGIITESKLKLLHLEVRRNMVSGKMKRDYLLLMYGEPIIRQMAALKRIFDPHRILNIGNLFWVRFFSLLFDGEKNPLCRLWITCRAVCCHMKEFFL